MQELKDVLSLAYRGAVMSEPVLQKAHSAFAHHVSNPAFIESVHQEIARCEAVKDRCFVSRQHLEFLTTAMERHHAAD